MKLACVRDEKSTRSPHSGTWDRSGITSAPGQCRKGEITHDVLLVMAVDVGDISCFGVWSLEPKQWHVTGGNWRS